jgi:trimethylguanosine synthase
MPRDWPDGTVEGVRRRFSRPLAGDPDGLYMMNYEVAARYLARRLSGLRVLELCCGVGASTLCLAAECPHVIAVDLNEGRLADAKRNAQAWGVADRIDFLHGDALDEVLLASSHVDVVVADPEFQPEGYDPSRHASDLRLTQPPTDALVRAVRTAVGESIALRLSRVADLDQVAEFGAIEVEAVTIDGTLRFYYAYFGSVAQTRGRTEVMLSTQRGR